MWNLWRWRPRSAGRPSPLSLARAGLVGAVIVGLVAIAPPHAAESGAAETLADESSATLRVTYPCPECTEWGASTTTTVARRDPETGGLRGVASTVSYESPAGIYAHGLEPGQYIVLAGGQYGTDQTRTIVDLSDGENASVTIERDLAALHVRDATGRVLRYDNNGRGRLASAVVVEPSGFGGWARMVDAGDLTSDGERDLLGITSDGRMMRLDGLSGGGFADPQLISTSWQNYTQIIPFGDHNGDGDFDIVGLGRSGTLYLFRGDGQGGFEPRRMIGSPGAFAPYVKLALLDDDGPQLFAISKTGRAYVFSEGTGHLSYGVRTLVATGWSNVTQVVGVGAFNQDVMGDLVIRRSGGTVYLVKMANSATPKIAGYITLAKNWNKRLLF